MGAMQLFAACQKAPTVRRVDPEVDIGGLRLQPVRSGDVHRGQQRRRPPREGFARDSIDIEGYARGLGRRRPDIAVTILRLANMIGPAMDTALSRYLAGPLVPTVLGRDARLQLLHEQDALGALERATMVWQAGHLQHRRQRHHHDVAGDPALRPARRSRCPRSGCGSSIRWCGTARGRELNRDQTRLHELRPGDGHLPDADRARVPAEVDHDGSVRRLRARAWIDADYRSAVGTLCGESRRGGGAASWLRANRCL